MSGDTYKVSALFVCVGGGSPAISEDWVLFSVWVKVPKVAATVGKKFQYLYLVIPHFFLMEKMGGNYPAFVE